MYAECVLGLVFGLGARDAEADNAGALVHLKAELGVLRKLARTLVPGDVRKRMAVDHRLEEVVGALFDYLVLGLLDEVGRLGVAVCCQRSAHFSLATNFHFTNWKHSTNGGGSWLGGTPITQTIT